MPEKPPCYGTMFPLLSGLEDNRPCRGKVFTALLVRRGVGVQSRRLAVDKDAWDACQTCSDYRSCYDLSMALINLDNALDRI